MGFPALTTVEALEGQEEITILQIKEIWGKASCCKAMLAPQNFALQLLNTGGLHFGISRFAPQQRQLGATPGIFLR